MSSFEDVVESAAITILEDLGYSHLRGGDLDDERSSTVDVILENRFRRSLARLNPHLDADALGDVARQIVQAPTASVAENNRLFHRALTRGIEVEVEVDGERRDDHASLVDFGGHGEPDRNDWLVVDQLTIRGPSKTCRPDLAIYLNGLPVAVFEFKSPTRADVGVEDAWDQLQDYQNDIPSLFDTNEMLVASDGTEARVGSLTAGFEWFGPWKSVEGERPKPGTTSSLERLLRGLFDRRRFLQYLRHYIFWEAGAERIKKIAGYHQFYAMQKAVDATVRAYKGEGDHRIGVVWHTQGSGKSVSMTFYAGRVVRHLDLDNPTLVVLTDRRDLDRQLYDQFASASGLLPSPVQAESREHLRQLLDVRSGGVIFTTLQKFSTGKGVPMEVLNDRRNLIVLADEAHRSHYEFADGLAKNLQDALPNALYLGFTGTPVDLAGRDTVAVFGKYLDVYPMSQSVEDGATVPLDYEARQDQVYLLEERMHEIDQEVAEATSDLPETERQRLQREETRLIRILGDLRLLRGVAGDLVEHWERRQEILRGKGMIAVPERHIAGRLYEQLCDVRPSWHSADPSAGRLKVVMSGDPKEDAKKYGSDLVPHLHSESEKQEIERRFKDPESDLELVIVVDMWLTGFDVPPAHTLYLYKPMKGHTLMQAIARVNRKWGEKPSGLIVDYVGVGAELKKAVGAYGGYPGARLAAPIEEKLRVLEERFEIVESLFHSFDYERFFTGDERHRLRVLVEAAEHLTSVDDGRERFLTAMTPLNLAAGMALHREEVRDLREKVAFFQAVQRNLQKYTSSDERPEESSERWVSHAERERHREAIRQIISGSLASRGVMDIFEAAGLPKPEVSILSEEFLLAVRRSPYQNLQVEILQKLLAEQIREQRRHNLVQSRKFSEMLRQSLNRYRNRGIQAAQVIVELIEIARQVREAPRRGESLGLTDDQLAFYDALADHEGVTDVMQDDTLSEIARQLVDRIRNSVTIDWTQKEAVRAKMRSDIGRILRRNGYPPDKQKAAVNTVIEQAEHLGRDWASDADPETEPPVRIVYDDHGSAVVAGTNTKVIEILSHQRAYDETPDEIHRSLPHLSVRQAATALRYAEEHSEEIEKELARRAKVVVELQREFGQPPIVELLRKRRSQA